MTTWPSGSKASATTTAADTNSISGARGDINQAITNQNDIIDMFNIDGSETNGQILKYNSTTAKFELTDDHAGNPLDSDLDQNGFMIEDTSRNFQILGNESNTTTLTSHFDSFSNTAMVHGVVNVNTQTGYPANRIHSNPTLSYIQADADATSGSSSPGRIRHNYVESIYDLNSYDNTTSGFGQGQNGMFVSAVTKNTSSGTTSNLTEQSALVVTPQIDTSENVIITDMAGVEVQARNNNSGSSSTNFYGFYYNAPAGPQASRIGLTNHYSFYGADSDATLYNAGPLEASGLKYPTSDGTANQILKTDGSGNLSFTDDAGGIALTDLSVGAEASASGDGAISYDNTTGVFTYTPPTAAGIGALGLTALSVGAEGAASGDGNLAYDNTTGVFTYTPPVLSGLSGDTDDIGEGSTNLYYTDARARASISVGAELSASGDGAISYDNTTGVLRYTPPTLAGVGGTTDDVSQGSNNVYFSTTGNAVNTTNLPEGTNLYYTDARARAVSIENVSEDTTPQLGGDLDQNGNSINDSSRNYQIIGNEDNTTTLSGYFDSMGNLARVHGVINVNEIIGNPANRVHTNPTLSFYQQDADATGGGSSPGRIRMNYVEGILDLNSYDNTTSGFGQGHNAHFVSSVVENTASGTTSNLTESSTLTVAPQIDTANPVNITDMVGIEVRGYADDGGGGTITATNFYGYYYNAPAGPDSSRLGTSSHYSFYGADSNASTYNAGGYTHPSFTVATLPSNLPEGTTVYVTDESTVTSGKCLVFYDGSNWKLVHSPNTTAS